MPKQIPREAKKDVTAERPSLSTRENRLDTKAIQRKRNILLIFRIIFFCPQYAVSVFYRFANFFPCGILRNHGIAVIEIERRYVCIVLRIYRFYAELSVFIKIIIRIFSARCIVVYFFLHADCRKPCFFFIGVFPARFFFFEDFISVRIAPNYRQKIP